MKFWRQNEQDSGKRRLTIFVHANTIVSGFPFVGNETIVLRLGKTGLCTLVKTRYIAMRLKEFSTRKSSG